MFLARAIIIAYISIYDVNKNYTNSDQIREQYIINICVSILSIPRVHCKFLKVEAQDILKGSAEHLKARENMYMLLFLSFTPNVYRYRGISTPTKKAWDALLVKAFGHLSKFCRLFSQENLNLANLFRISEQNT